MLVFAPAFELELLSYSLTVILYIQIPFYNDMVMHNNYYFLLDIKRSSSFLSLILARPTKADNGLESCANSQDSSNPQGIFS